MIGVTIQVLTIFFTMNRSANFEKNKEADFVVVVQQYFREYMYVHPHESERICQGKTFGLTVLHSILLG